MNHTAHTRQRFGSRCFCSGTLQTVNHPFLSLTHTHTHARTHTQTHTHCSLAVSIQISTFLYSCSCVNIYSFSVSIFTNTILLNFCFSDMKFVSGWKPASVWSIIWLFLCFSLPSRTLDSHSSDSDCRQAVKSVLWSTGDQRGVCQLLLWSQRLRRQRRLLHSHDEKRLEALTWNSTRPSNQQDAFIIMSIRLCEVALVSFCAFIC